MSFLDTIRRFFGSAEVTFGDVNQRVAGGAVKPRGGTGSLPQSPADLPPLVVLPEYRAIQDLLDSGCPVVFVTGNAGTGKSTLIRHLRESTTKQTVVLAPTGIAALQVGGATIHSFFHFPPTIRPESGVKPGGDRNLYRSLELLIIDEISMVRCDLLDAIDSFLRKQRRTKLPFGGVQLLLVGDLFQLGPVTPTHEADVLRAMGYLSRYFFSAECMRATRVFPAELTNVFRQTDGAFIDMLNLVRTADSVERVTEDLNARCFETLPPARDITLTSTNAQADGINRIELERLMPAERLYVGKTEGTFIHDKDKLPSPMDLRLKVGARVMFTKNGIHWVNGSLGIVRGMDEGSVRVEMVTDAKGTVCTVPPATWGKYRYEFDSVAGTIVPRKTGSYTQIPLMLAWAVTIHKSQGRTLDRVLVDLGQGAFEFGQAYVALSRCRSIEGLRLARPLRTTDIKCHPMVKDFYAQLRPLLDSFGAEVDRALCANMNETPPVV